ncbi:MAG: hypothetical protein R3D70_25070 [Rhizobiaceae bacterium]
MTLRVALSTFIEPNPSGAGAVRSSDTPRTICASKLNHGRMKTEPHSWHALGKAADQPEGPAVEEDDN